MYLHVKVKCYIIRLFQLLGVCGSTWLCLMLWQFSQFVIATQTVALSAMFIVGAVDRDTFLIILFGQGVSITSFNDDIIMYALVQDFRPTIMLPNVLCVQWQLFH
jgi:hypothetical protein